MFKKILIANRGEIALRILRACEELDIKTVAVYSSADKDLKHVKMADESICIGPAESAKSYLNVAAIISASELTGIDAIHPGVGFLSENDHFAQQVTSSGYKFIGPDSETIKVMGNKITAKEAVISAGMQPVPGTGRINSEEEALKMADEIGYPVIIKVAAGGGGKGIQICKKKEEFLSKLSLTQIEALNSFGSDEVYIEKYLQTPRHVEIQVAADDYGNAVHFFERDCSIQRRNQKIIEEAPAFDIPQEKLDEIRNIAVNTCKKLNYKGLGTFEFLYEDGNFYFIEMNTRLQVEHTITEMITGIDLVKLQIMIAAGQEIPLSQEDINCRGHAIECRINAEHHETFIPSPGKVTEFHPPGGFRIRTDSHLYSGYTVPQYYDALIAKICAHSSDRISAIRKMRVALEETYIEGINTNAPLHQRILIEPNFVEEKISINYLRDILNIK